MMKSKVTKINKEKLNVTDEQKIMYETIINNAKPIGKPSSKRYSASVPIKLLFVDPAYQRIETRSEQKIIALANRWSESKLTPITLVPHPEEYRFAVVDGYGRLRASQMLLVPYTELDGIILTDVPEDPEERRRFEAEIFIGQDNETEPVKPVQKHNARLLLGDNAAIIIQDICDKYGLSFTGRQGSRDGGVLGSYPTTYEIANTHGRKCIEFIFATINDAGWKTEPNGCSTYIMRSLKDTWVAHPNERKEIHDYLSQELRMIDPALFKSRAVTKYPYRDARTACSLYTEDILCMNLRLSRKIYDKGSRKIQMIN